MDQREPSIPDEIRALLGREAPPETRPPVTLEQVQRYCYAVDDLNPLYLDARTAEAGPYGGVIAPPLFAGVPSFKPASLSDLREDGLPAQEGDPLRVSIPGARSRLTGAAFEFFEPVRPGDALTRHSHLADLYAKEGRSGALVFSVRETRTTNQRGALVCIERSTTAAVQGEGGSRGSVELALTLAPGSRAESIGFPPPPSQPRLWEEVQEGDEVSAMLRRTTPVQVFLYGAVKGNSHLIHYDRDYAQREGLPERVAQGDLLGDFLCQLAVRWMGPSGRLRRFAYEVRGPGFIGEEIVHRGRVERKWRDADGTGLVTLGLWSEGTKGRLCLRGSATVTLPSRG
jgi:3-methylfumaryl-CoA hydratase